GFPGLGACRDSDVKLRLRCPKLILPGRTGFGSAQPRRPVHHHSASHQPGLRRNQNRRATSVAKNLEKMRFVTGLQCKHAHREVRLTWLLFRSVNTPAVQRVKGSEDCNCVGSGTCPVTGPCGERDFSMCPYIPPGSSG